MLKTCTPKNYFSFNRYFYNNRGLLKEQYDPELTKQLSDCLHFDISEYDLSFLKGMKPLEGIPMGDMFANERINIYVDNQPAASIIIVDGIIEEVGGVIEDPSMNMYLDSEIIDRMISGGLEFVEALLNGDIKYEGVGFFNAIKVFFANIGMWFYSLFE